MLLCIVIFFFERFSPPPTSSSILAFSAPSGFEINLEQVEGSPGKGGEKTETADYSLSPSLSISLSLALSIPTTLSLPQLPLLLFIICTAKVSSSLGQDWGLDVQMKREKKKRKETVPAPNSLKSNWRQGVRCDEHQEGKQERRRTEISGIGLNYPVPSSMPLCLDRYLTRLIYR